MTEEVWNQVRNAKEDLIMMINESAGQVAPDTSGIELSKKIFEMVMSKKFDPIGLALSRRKKRDSTSLFSIDESAADFQMWIYLK